jgi:hypothetical protein
VPAAVPSDAVHDAVTSQHARRSWSAVAATWVVFAMSVVGSVLLMVHPTAATTPPQPVAWVAATAVAALVMLAQVCLTLQHSAAEHVTPVHPAAGKSVAAFRTRRVFELAVFAAVQMASVHWGH